MESGKAASRNTCRFTFVHPDRRSQHCIGSASCKSPLVCSQNSCHTPPKVTGKGISVAEQKFVTLHRACRTSLKQLCKEADQMLNMLALVKLFPGDSQKETALRLQYDRENQAHVEYTRLRHDLFGLLTDSAAVKAIKKELKSGWPLDPKA
jgi:hypothetical protein